MPRIKQKLMIAALSLLTAGVLVILSIIVLKINAELPAAVLWFLLLAAIIGRARRRFERLAAIILILALWSIVNERAMSLIELALQTNPYGAYFFDHFEWRLTLSIFLLKFAAFFWLTDLRLLLTALLLIVHSFAFIPLKRKIYDALPQKWFEFFVHFFAAACRAVAAYLQTSVVAAVINAPLWGAAAFLLRFDNAPLLLFIMAVASFIPRIGFSAGVAFSLLFVESGLFLFQLGGMLIAAASIWFVHHALTGSQERAFELPTALLSAGVAALALFSFTGLFVAMPSIAIGHALADAFSRSLPLRFPRKDVASVIVE